MIQSMLTASLGIVGMMVAWIGIQSVWRKLFADQISDEDVLAERRSCGDCGCRTICRQEEKRQAEIVESLENIEVKSS